MDDAFIVRRFQCFSNLCCDAQRFIKRERAPENLAKDQIHHQRTSSARFFNVVNLGDVRMVCPADLVLVGIGVVPNIELARDAGLSVSNGLVVDEHLRTEDEGIYALGDCANHPNPFAGRRARIESVQNAVDQAKCIAAAIVGRSENYRSVPWFWTDQFDIKLQMAGLSSGCDLVVTRGEPESRKFSVFYFRDGRLAAVDSINRPGDHLAGRKLLGAGTPMTPEQAADPSVDLKALR